MEFRGLVRSKPCNAYALLAPCGVPTPDSCNPLCAASSFLSSAVCISSDVICTKPHPTNFYSLMMKKNQTSQSYSIFKPLPASTAVTDRANYNSVSSLLINTTLWGNCRASSSWQLFGLSSALHPANACQQPLHPINRHRRLAFPLCSLSLSFSPCLGGYHSIKTVLFCRCSIVIRH